jgi:hypothetical protein
MSEKKPKDKLPKDCGVCGYHLQSKECRRHAPHPNHDEPYIPVQWNLTQNTDRCGSGTTKKFPVRCDDCVHWQQPGGKGLDPDYKHGRPDAWWQGAGICTASAPGVARDEPEFTYWPVTHGEYGGCGDGISIEEMRAAEAERANQKQLTEAE